MQLGLIGTGNMARAMARGWGRPVLCADPATASAESLVAELGGEVVGSNAELARRADVVVLCHKPAQLQAVADEIRGDVTRVASILGAVDLATLQAAYPDAAVYRFMPSMPVEVREGVVAHSPSGAAGEDEVVAAFAELGKLVSVPESLIDVSMALMSCAPAFMALVAEAQIDAGVRRGLTPAVAADLVVQTMAGTAALLQARDMDTLAVRRAVTSPGGSTARGLDALERACLRAAFSDAIDAVLR